MDETETQKTMAGNKRPQENDDTDGPSAKKAATNLVEPITPTADPCGPSYDILALANSNAKNSNPQDTTQVVQWVIYLAVQESHEFGQTLKECQAMAANAKDIADKQFQGCLQLEGTRHITLWTGPMTKAQARQVEFARDAVPPLPLSNITFPQWFTNKGAYLGLSSAMENRLQEMIVEELEGLPSSSAGSSKKVKVSCNHLSLYRSRGMNWGKFQQACSKIRQAFPASNWGSVQGVSVRLKVVGSDYSHCRVLAGSS